LKLVRSKNVGPFWLTIDIMFDDAEAYHHASDAEILNRAASARLYNNNRNEIIVVNHDMAQPIKVSFPAHKAPAQSSTATPMAASNTRRFWDWGAGLRQAV
jgi:hypothetical protein